MMPLSLFSLAFFAIQWGINAKQNYDLYMDHPPSRRHINVLPRALIDQLSAEFTFLISLGVLSILLITFIDYRLNELLMLAGGVVLAAFNVSDYLYSQRLKRELQKEK